MVLFKQMKTLISILNKVKKGQRPRNSVTGLRILLRRGMLKFKTTGKRFGEGKIILTDKGKKLLKVSNLLFK